MALIFGLIAALCWGVHDLLVRVVSQKVNILGALAVVLGAGCCFSALLSMTMGEVQVLPGRGLLLSALSGLAFVTASLGLYAAFRIGPVRLVAPIIAAYPVLSFTWASFNGASIAVFHWTALLAIAVGVAVVAGSDADETEASAQKPRAIAFAFVSAIGFAATFALGQAATEFGPESTVNLTARLFAFAGVITLAVAKGTTLRPPRPPVPVLLAMALLDTMALGLVLAAGVLPNAHHASATSSIFGLLTVVLAWVFLKEPMAMRQWLGVLLAFAGIFVLSV